MHIQTRRDKLALLHLTSPLHEKESFTSCRQPQPPLHHCSLGITTSKPLISLMPQTKQESHTQQRWIVAQQWSLQFDQPMTNGNKYIQALNSRLKLNPVPTDNSLKKYFSTHIPSLKREGKSGIGLLSLESGSVRTRPEARDGSVIRDCTLKEIYVGPSSSPSTKFFMLVEPEHVSPGSQSPIDSPT